MFSYFLASKNSGCLAEWDAEAHTERTLLTRFFVCYDVGSRTDSLQTHLANWLHRKFCVCEEILAVAKFLTAVIGSGAGVGGGGDISEKRQRKRSSFSSHHIFLRMRFLLRIPPPLPIPRYPLSPPPSLAKMNWAELELFFAISMFSSSYLAISSRRWKGKLPTIEIAWSRFRISQLQRFWGF